VVVWRVTTAATLWKIWWHYKYFSRLVSKTVVYRNMQVVCSTDHQELQVFSSLWKQLLGLPSNRTAIIACITKCCQETWCSLVLSLIAVSCICSSELMCKIKMYCQLITFYFKDSFTDEWCLKVHCSDLVCWFSFTCPVPEWYHYAECVG